MRALRRRSDSGAVLLTVCRQPGSFVPANIHDQMEVLASQGAIPITTAAQRSRQRGTGGSSYGVPRVLSDAARYGYISQPAGAKWATGSCHLHYTWQASCTFLRS